MANPSIAIVVVSGSEASGAVVAQLREWRERGLVERTVVVPLPSTSGLPGPAPRVPCVDLGETNRGADLLRLLAEESWTRVELLCLFDVEAQRFGEQAGFDPYRRSLDVIDEVRRAMPLNQDATGAGGVVLTTVRLLGPTSSGEAFPSDWGGYEQAWDYSLVVAPEDRRSPDSSADHIRWPGNYAAHMAGSLAAVGGLWAGMSSAALPPTRPGQERSGSDRDALRVVRTQSRVAGAEIPMEGIRQQVVQIAQGERSYPQGSDVKLRPVGAYAAEGLIRQATDKLLEHTSMTLQYRPVPEPEPTEKDAIRRSAALEKLRHFTFGHRSDKARRQAEARGISFPGGAMGEPFHVLRAWFTRKVDEAVTDVALGEEAAVKVVTPLATQLAERWNREWQRIRQEEASRPRQDPPSDYSADFWAVLRGWLLGLVDGARPGIDPDLVSAIDIVRDRARIVPEPTDVPLSEHSQQQLASDLPFSPYDSWTVAAGAGLLERAATELGSDLESPGADTGPIDAAQRLAATDVLFRNEQDLERIERARAARAVNTGRPVKAKRTAGRWGHLFPAAVSVAALVGAGFFWVFDERFPAVVLVLMFLPLLIWSISAIVRNKPEDVPEIMMSAPLGKEFGASHPLAQRPPDTPADGQGDAAVGGRMAADAHVLRRWLNRYHATMVGQLSRTAGESADRAARDWRDALISYEGLAWIDTSDQRRRRDSWLFWFWFAPLMLIGGILLILWWYMAKAGPTVTIPLVAVIDSRTLTGVLLFSWTSLCVYLYLHALLAYHRATRALENRMIQWGIRARTLSDRMTHARSEAHRLRTTNVQLGRWAEVFSWVVRNPYGLGPLVVMGAPVVPEAAEVPEEVLPEPVGESPVEAEGEEPQEGGVGVPPVAPAAEAEAPPDAPEPVRPVAPSVLSTQIGEVLLNEAFEEGELRRAVEVGVGVGWLTALFYELAGYAFEDLRLSGSDVVLRMDRDGSEQQSTLALFIAELREGECQRRAAEMLADRLVEFRAELEDRGGRSVMSLPVQTEFGLVTVDGFLAELESTGTTMRRDLFLDPAIVGREHSLEDGVLWTHAVERHDHGDAPPPRLRVVFEDVVPDEDRIQLVAVRIDATGLVETGHLACFQRPAGSGQVRSEWIHNGGELV